MNIMDDETKQKHLKNFIGGLYPPVDKDMMPLYLRDTADAGTDLSRPLDLVYFWHIPKVCRCVCLSFGVVSVRTLFWCKSSQIYLIHDIVIIDNFLPGIGIYYEEHIELLLRVEASREAGSQSREFYAPKTDMLFLIRSDASSIAN